jgi:hypothetical protein
LLVLAPRSCRYGVFGRLIETCSKGLQPKPTDPRLFLNTNAPLSAVICGVQGSGKVRRFLIFPQTSFLILRLISIPPISALLACSPSPSLPPSRSLPKSHSVSILLESMLLQDPRVGSLKRPLSTAVFHFGESGASSQPCEAAFIANCSDPVRPFLSLTLPAFVLII